MHAHAPRLKRAGGFAALYVAAAYLAVIPYFVFLVDHPSITDPDDKVTFLLAHHASMYVMHLISFELVALALIVITLAIHQHLHEDATATSQVACAVGLIRAGLLLTSVMVFNHGMAAVVDQQATDPQQSAATWHVIETIANALGGTGGDVLGGLWLLLISWAALRAGKFPRPLNWLGLTVGTAALLSAVPAPGILEVVVGLLMIVWFLWFGIITTRPRPATSPGTLTRALDRRPRERDADMSIADAARVGILPRRWLGGPRRHVPGRAGHRMPCCRQGRPMFDHERSGRPQS